MAKTARQARLRVGRLVGAGETGDREASGGVRLLLTALPRQPRCI